MSAPLNHRDITHAFHALNAELQANQRLLDLARDVDVSDFEKQVQQQRERVSRFERAMHECDFHQVTE